MSEDAKPRRLALWNIAGAMATLLSGLAAFAVNYEGIATQFAQLLHGDPNIISLNSLDVNNQAGGATVESVCGDQLQIYAKEHPNYNIIMDASIDSTKTNVIGPRIYNFHCFFKGERKR